MRQIKRVTALFLSLALLLTMLPGAAWAAETEELPEEAAVTEEATTETDEAQETSPESSVSGETEDDEASETEAEAADEPAAVSEEDIATVSDEVASGTCGDNLTWVLDGDYVLTISGTGDMTDWTDYSEVPWYSYGKAIAAVKIGNGVTSIGAYAFSHWLKSGDYNYLVDFTMPDSVTSIGECAFQDCYRAENVIIGDGVTSIGTYAFDSCLRLASVTIGSNVTSIGYGAFRFCWSLTSIVIPDSVTSIEDSAFGGCTSLTSVSIGTGLTSIGDCAFGDCESLTDITVNSGNLVYSSVDGVVFSKDKTSLICYPSGKSGAYTIPDGVTSVGDDAFYSCAGLTSVTIPDSVISIGASAFDACTSLTNVDIPDSVTSIDAWAFGLCSALTDVTIPDSVTFIGGYAFYRCESLTSIVIPDSVISLGSSAFEECENLVSVSIGNGVTSIADSTFDFCKSLTNVTIGNSVTNIGEYAFHRCESLNSIVIPDSVTSIGDNAFAACYVLSSVTILSSVTSIGERAFESCDELVDVYYSGSKTEWAAISVAYGNECLTSATIHYGKEDHTHTYDTPTWAWSGTSSATATFTCIEGDDTQTVTATVASTTTAATCTTAGKTVYTAKVTFEGETYTDTKTVTVAATGHSYSTPTWAWSEDYSKVTANFTCSVCGEQETAAATVTYEVTTAATYTAAGTGTYTATVTFNGKTYTDTKTVTIPMLVLTAPTITSLYNSTSGVSVGWDAVDGATEYIVWRLNNSTGKWEKCATTTGTTYLSTSPVSGTTYYYAIEAVNGDVTSGRGTQRYILYMATPKVSLENTTSGIKVSWNSVTGATSGYQVYRRTADTDYELLKAVSTSTTSYTDTTAEAGVRYYYIVRSVRGSARSAYASQYITRLTTPTGISVSNTKSGVQVTWNSVTGATSYQVWRKLSGSSSWSKVGTTTDTSYTSTGVTSGKTYVFTVKAVYNSSVSAYNTTGKTIMRLAEPTITLENLVGGLTASWNAVDGAEGYKLYRRSETGSYVLVATLDADELSYTDKAAGAGLVFYYRVQAYNGSYTSSWTSQFNRRIGHTTLSLAKGEDGVVLTWTESGGCTGYYIYRMNEDGSYTRIKTITSANTLTWTDTDVDLTSGNVYTYIVRGYNGSSLGSYTPKKTSDFF